MTDPEIDTTNAVPDEDDNPEQQTGDRIPDNEDDAGDPYPADYEDEHSRRIAEEDGASE